MTSLSDAYTDELLGEPVTDEPRFEDVMIDIETMSLHPHNALILSIGMIEFNQRSAAKGLLLGKRKLLIPEITPQLLMGRQVDASTQKFWQEQKPEARDHWLNATEHWPPHSVVSEVREFCAGHLRVWANGTQFDLSNIVGFKEQAEATSRVKSEGPLWHYRAPRDMRTFCEETPITRVTHPENYQAFADKLGLIAHEPVSDCISQAHRVWEHSTDV